MKLHLGCGQKYIPGFIHVDVVPHPHVDYVTDISQLFPFADNSVELIYTCHTLEHFPAPRVPMVLKEWYRVLKPKGLLRIAVPDFAAISRVYQRSFDLTPLLGLLFGRQDYLYNIHHTVFDVFTLATMLFEAGFHSIHRYKWQNTEHADVDDFSQAYIPHMDKVNGELMSLNIEATK